MRYDVVHIAQSSATRYILGICSVVRVIRTVRKERKYLHNPRLFNFPSLSSSMRSNAKDNFELFVLQYR